MIDREARDKLAESIRALVSGQITNYEFEARVPDWSKDPAIKAVFNGGPWMLYDDFRTYRLRGAYKLVPELKTEVARWVIFLKTDLEYEWPVQNFLQRLLHFLGNVCTVGLVGLLYRRRLEKHGDVNVWPFVKESDYKVALEQPPYLSALVEK